MTISTLICNKICILYFIDTYNFKILPYTFLNLFISSIHLLVGHCSLAIWDIYIFSFSLPWAVYNLNIASIGYLYLLRAVGFPPGSEGKVSARNARDRVRSLDGEDPLEKEMATTPVPLPGKSHGWRSLEGHSPWGRTEWDTTERLCFAVKRSQ